MPREAASHFCLSCVFINYAIFRAWESGTEAYTKCFFMHHDDETSYSGKVQIDSLALPRIG